MKTKQIKFNKHNVTDGVIKARVSFYSIGNRIDKRDCVTIYARDYDHSLGKIFTNEYKNETDSMTDYFDQGNITLFKDHPLYFKALERAEKNQKEILKKQGNK